MSERVLSRSKSHSPLSSNLRDSCAQISETIIQRPAWSYCTRVDETTARKGNFWPRAVGFELTHKCNIDCSMCGAKKHGMEMAELPLEIVCDAIDQASKLGIKVVQFSGGEVLATYKDFFICADYAHSKGMKGTLMTNAYWATSLEASARMASRLVESGIVSLGASLDKDHADHIPPIRVANAIEGALAQDLSVAVCVADRASTKLENNRLLGELAQRLSGKIESNVLHLSRKDINIHRGPVERSGNAAKLEDSEFIREKLDKNKIYLECPSETIVVKPDEKGSAEIVPCCSFTPSSRGFFSLGSIQDTDLKTAREKMNSSILGGVAHGVFGFERIRNVLLDKGDPQLADLAEGSYTTICDACATIFSDPKAVTYLTQTFNSFVDADPSVIFSKGTMASEESAQVVIKKGYKEEMIKFLNYVGPLSNVVYFNGQRAAQLTRIEELERKYGINLKDSKDAILQMLDSRRRV